MTSMEMSGHCPICRNPYVSSSPPGENTRYQCMQCGEFILTRMDRSILENLLEEKPNGRRILSYIVRKMQRNEPPILDHDKIEVIIENCSLPSLREQEDNLISYIGNNSAPGVGVPMDYSLLFGVLGSINGAGIDFVIDHLTESGLLTHAKNRHV
jgi:hypothetical protein